MKKVRFVERCGSTFDPSLPFWKLKVWGDVIGHAFRIWWIYPRSSFSDLLKQCVNVGKQAVKKGIEEKKKV